MGNFKSSEEVLEFAIAAEQDAINFYSDLYNQTQDKHMKTAYREFIVEEKSHKQKLLKLKSEGINDKIEITKIADLKISDYLPQEIASENMEYKDALVVAMHKEKAAFRLYTDLARLSDNEDLKRLFLFLANEEAKHKLMFETEYDDMVLKEN